MMTKIIISSTVLLSFFFGYYNGLIHRDYHYYIAEPDGIFRETDANEFWDISSYNVEKGELEDNNRL